MWPLQPKLPDILQELPREGARNWVGAAGIENEAPEACSLVLSCYYYYYYYYYYDYDYYYYYFFCSQSPKTKRAFARSACAEVQQLTPMSHVQRQQSSQDGSKAVSEVGLVEPTVPKQHTRKARK